MRSGRSGRSFSAGIVGGGPTGGYRVDGGELPGIVVEDGVDEDGVDEDESCRPVMLLLAINHNHEVLSSWSITPVCKI